MADLIGKIVAAIIRQEGAAPDALNPGNLRAAPWFPNAVVIGGFWQPASRAIGIAGIYHVVALHIAEGTSLRRLIYSWAPPSDNNPTETYLENVANWTGISQLDAPLWNLLEPTE